MSIEVIKPHEIGQYWKAQTPTPGTGIALGGATQTGFVATTPTVIVRNSDVSPGKRLILDYVKFILTAAGTGITRVEAAVIVDNITRYSSGGSQLSVVGAHMDEANPSIPIVHGGAITALAASGAVRNAGRHTLSKAAPAIGDVYLLDFSALERGVPFAGPAIIGPGNHSFLVYLWFPGSTAAASGEIEVAGWLR